MRSWCDRSYPGLPRHTLWSSRRRATPLRPSRWPAPPRRHQPKILDALDDFSRMPSISIDYGVMEPESQTTRRIAMVLGDFGWSDVGSFAALPDVRALDERGNALSGDALAVESDDCVV